MTWGDAIAVNGKRPEWLTDDDALDAQWSTKLGWYSINTGDMTKTVWGDLAGVSTLAHIRLPADHPYYKVQAYNAQHGTNFTYWGGGERAPGDWDGVGPLADDDGGNLRILSSTPNPACWLPRPPQLSVRIIGYTRRPAVAEHMTEREAREHGADDVVVAAMLAAGILRDETPTERFKNARPDWRLLDRSELIDCVLVWSAIQ